MKKTNHNLLKIIQMITRRLILMMLLLVVGCQQSAVDGGNPTSGSSEKSTKSKISRQLKINRDALFKGSNEQIRVDAADVMLFSEEPLAREILLEALEQSDSVAARIAVCKALSQARAEKKTINNKDDFIEPLFNILNTGTGDSAKLAAETLLIFEYEQISQQLEKMVADTSLSPEARLNAIYALKLQPDMRAIFSLIRLLDDSEAVVVIEAERTLRSLGIPVGRNASTRNQIINELKGKGRDAFLRDWLVRQEAQMRKLETERDFWQKQYLSALEQIYDTIDEDTTKGKFLVKQLTKPEAVIKLWALEKISQWRVGTKSRLPADELGPVLMELVSNQDREVRLKTAKLLSLMGEVNSAEKLLEQHKVERDDEVKTELFVALGGACYYAFLPDSGIKLAPEIRKQTLELASEYIAEQDPKKAQKGAEVLKKLLEQDGLAAGEVDRYLGLLVKRYEQQKGNSDSMLRGELLRAMAGLCAQSVYKAESVRRFGPLFEEALVDSAELVREAAVDGLVYIDKAKALKILRKDFVNDSSVAIRRRVVELASEVGSKDDLNWLADKIGTGAESELAWQAMLKIFKRSEMAVLEEWIARFDVNSQYKLTDEQRIAFLEVAERKAVGENKVEILRDVRMQLARLYSKDGEFKRAAEYLGLLLAATSIEEQKEAILGELLGVYLRWPNVKAAKDLVNNCLLETDLEPNNVIVQAINTYLNEPAEGTNPNIIVGELVKIEISEPRPMWAEHLQRWREKYPEGPEKADKRQKDGK